MDRVERDKACAVLASAQYGCISREQALAAGFSDDALGRKLVARDWIEIRPKVYASAGSPESWLRSLMAATLWAGPGSAVSHRSAARLWGIEGFASSRVEISTPRNLRSPRYRDLIHRVEIFSSVDLRRHQRLLVTSPERTLIDLAAVESARRLESALDQILCRGRVSLRHLERRLFTRARRRGSEALNQLVRERIAGAAPMESPLEIDLWQLIVDAGLPHPVRQHRVWEGDRCLARLDLAYPDQQIALEADGFGSHSSPRSLQRDNRRQTDLSIRGWCVLRFTWHDVHREPERVVASIGRALSPTLQTG